MIVRDELAISRTVLANERTLLAYLRSGVALLIAGISIIHFAQQAWFYGVGIACLPAAAVTIIIGVQRYKKMNVSIKQHKEKSETISKSE